MWLVVHGKVYDASKWMHNHPGGQQAIINRAGGVEDATQDYEFHARAGAQALAFDVHWRPRALGGRAGTGLPYHVRPRAQSTFLISMLSAGTRCERV